MSDIHCDCCNESWDKYGLKHGDVKAWQADDILEGYGCPCCEANGFDPAELYGVGHKEVLIISCIECQLDLNISRDEIYYDGSRKMIYHNSGSVFIDSEDDIKRYVTIEHDWKAIDDGLVCQKCGEDYSKCEKCDCTISNEELKVFEDSIYCEFCDKKLITECDICKKEFLKEDLLIEGMNGECCCSEECADKTTEEV